MTSAYTHGGSAQQMTPWNQLDLGRCRVLDGGLATELEHRGIPLDGVLWSARAVRDAPDAVLAVHRDYLEAGADCLLTASYQASTLGYAEAFARQENVAGFEAEPLPQDQLPGGRDASPEAAVEWSIEARIFAMARAATRAALVASVEVAIQARDDYRRAGEPILGDPSLGDSSPGDPRPATYRPDHSRPILIAASLGPYGAALHNGAEFHGRYQVGFAELVEFHRERIAVLAPTQADLLAFETVPSLEEARAIVAALSTFPDIGAWISFSCIDEAHVAHGEHLRDCARFLDRIDRVLAVGVNCTPPAFITSLLGELREGTAKPAIVYPNSGEGWDAVRRCWTGVSDVEGYATLASEWFAAGAQMVGGCCRTGPAHIRAVADVAQALSEAPAL